MRWEKTTRKPEAGQAMLLILLVIGIALVGALAFCTDMGMLWYHRQQAQNAADAACTAGAMDLMLGATGSATGHQGFSPPTAFNCSAHPTYVPCQYAALNGYDGANTTPGNQVYVSFPGRPAGVPIGALPPTAMLANPFMRVDITDHVPAWFSGFLSGRTTRDVRAFAVCGAVLATSPIPIVVLDTRSPTSSPPRSALNIQGNGTIKIVGGPNRSIQVNSALNASSCGQSNCALNLPWGSAKIDLSQGGPSQTGSDLAAWGGPNTGVSGIPPSGFLPGTTGHWISPAPPISDPFAQVCAPGQTAACGPINGISAPSVPSAATTPAVPADLTSNTTCNTTAKIQSGGCQIAYHNAIHGCPDPAGCRLYLPGAYPTGISVGPGGSITAVFDPGLYYVTGGLALKSGSTVRPGIGPGDSTGGVAFYFHGGSGTNSISVAADSGSKKNLDAFNMTSGSGSYLNGVKCTSTSSIPSNLPSQVPANPATDGANILLGPCTGYYGDPLGAADPLGVQRGFLFFQDRAATSVDPSWAGGGQFLLAGTMYFHSCNASGTGEGCGAAGTWLNDIFSLSGNSGSGTYVLGNIVADNLTLGGTSGITMDLNPTAAYNILKATLLPWSSTD